MANIQEKTTEISREERNGITQELVRKIYDYKDGRLYYKVAVSNCTKIGSMAGYIHKRPVKGDRYMVKIKSMLFAGARIIFLWHHGYCPEIVDHKNRIKIDDHINNLRAATRSENARNRSSMRNSSSKYLGVFVRSLPSWCSVINVDGKHIHLGSFKTEEAAALAYNKAAEKYFGEFANLNIIEDD